MCVVLTIHVNCVEMYAYLFIYMDSMSLFCVSFQTIFIRRKTNGVSDEDVILKGHTNVCIGFRVYGA